MLLKDFKPVFHCQVLFKIVHSAASCQRNTILGLLTIEMAANYNRCVNPQSTGISDLALAAANSAILWADYIRTARCYC